MPDNEEQTQSNTIRKYIGMQSRIVSAIQGHFSIFLYISTAYNARMDCNKIHLQYVVKTFGRCFKKLFLKSGKQIS